MHHQNEKKNPSSLTNFGKIFSDYIWQLHIARRHTNIYGNFILKYLQLRIILQFYDKFWYFCNSKLGPVKNLQF